MIEKTDLNDNTHVLSIVVAPEDMELMKKKIFIELPLFFKTLIDEDSEELLFSMSGSYDLKHIRLVLDESGIEYKLSVLIANKKGGFDRPIR